LSATSKSIVVLISGSGTNLQAIINAVKSGSINANIAAVISNRPDAPGLERARKAGINAVAIDQKTITDRDQFDEALIDEIDKHGADLIVLAGFMRILTEKFIDRYEHRIINIHPSLLPEFKGLNTHRRVLEAGKTRHGASVHFVNIELDDGPVVIQAEVPVLPDDTEQSLAARVLEQEHIIYPMAISWYIDGRLEVNDNNILLDKSILRRPALWQANQLTFSEQP
jgi:phosphoribosylglycinamide formyltransferase-1